MALHVCISKEHQAKSVRRVAMRKSGTEPSRPSLSGRSKLLRFGPTIDSNHPQLRSPPTSFSRKSGLYQTSSWLVSICGGVYSSSGCLLSVSGALPQLSTTPRPKRPKHAETPHSSSMPVFSTDRPGSTVALFSSILNTLHVRS